MLFIRGLISEDRSVRDLIDSDYTYANAELARHYGIISVTGTQMRKVPIDRRTRGGVLGMGAVLMSTSNPERTSLVKRGKWVLEVLLDQPPPPPPMMDVAPLERQPATDASGKPLSLRARVERHRQDSACASCHRTMDSLGFGLENYDATGRWRERDGESSLDASGEYAGRRFSSPAELKQILLDHEQTVVRSLIAKLLTYALGRSVVESDTNALEKILAASTAQDHRFQVIICAVVESLPFRFRQSSAVAESVRP